MITDSLWNRKVVSQTSSVATQSLSRRPNSLRKSSADDITSVSLLLSILLLLLLLLLGSWDVIMLQHWLRCLLRLCRRSGVAMLQCSTDVNPVSWHDGVWPTGRSSCVSDRLWWYTWRCCHYWCQTAYIAVCRITVVIIGLKFEIRSNDARAVSIKQYVANFSGQYYYFITPSW